MSLFGNWFKNIIEEEVTTLVNKELKNQRIAQVLNDLSLPKPKSPVFVLLSPQDWLCLKAYEDDLMTINVVSNSVVFLPNGIATAIIITNMGITEMIYVRDASGRGNFLKSQKIMYEFNFPTRTVKRLHVCAYSERDAQGDPFLDINRVDEPPESAAHGTIHGKVMDAVLANFIHVH